MAQKASPYLSGNDVLPICLACNQLIKNVNDHGVEAGILALIHLSEDGADYMFHHSLYLLKPINL